MAKSTLRVEISLQTIWQTVGILAIAWFLFAVRDILLLLFLAIIVSSAVQPVVDRLERKNIPRLLSAASIYIFVITLLILFIKIITPVLFSEVKELTDVLETYLVQWSGLFNSFTKVINTWNIQREIGGLSEATSTLGANVFNNTLGALAGLFKTLIVISLSFYMVVKEDGAWGFVKSLVPAKYEAYAIDLIRRIQGQVGRWMIGQFILVVIIFVLEYAVLLLLQVPMALTLALLGGLLEIIPYIGPTVSVIPAFLIALNVSPLVALMVVVAYILIQQLENHIIVPLLMNKAVGLNPVVIILVLLIGGKLAGVSGLILAVPLAAALNVVWDDLVNRGVGGKAYKVKNQ